MTKKTESTLSASERKDARHRSAPGVAVVYEAIRQEGEDELSRSNQTLFWSGLAAGLSMGFSFLAEALLQSGLPDAPWQTLVSKLSYSVGFLIVILGRQQLFTENTLTPVLHVLQKKTRHALVNTSPHLIQGGKALKVTGVACLACLPLVSWNSKSLWHNRHRSECVSQNISDLFHSWFPMTS